MTAPNPTRQKLARTKINDCISNPANCSVVHYSCESFYDRLNRRSPRITSIAVLDLGTDQITSFSIHLVAEKEQVGFADIRDQYDHLELKMLEEYFAYLKSYQDRKYVHWNMRDVGYGFEAIQHRFRALGGSSEDVFVIDNTKKIDLAMVLKDIYGDTYVSHPRMETLFSINGKIPKDFLTGQEEAHAFENGEYYRFHRSTLGKVQAFADIARLVHDGNLKTDCTFWNLHGGTVRTSLMWVGDHPALALVGFAVTVVGVVLGAIAIL